MAEWAVDEIPGESVKGHRPRNRTEAHLRPAAFRGHSITAHTIKGGRTAQVALGPNL